MGIDMCPSGPVTVCMGIGVAQDMVMVSKPSMARVVVAAGSGAGAGGRRGGACAQRGGRDEAGGQQRRRAASTSGGCEGGGGRGGSGSGGGGGGRSLEMAEQQAQAGLGLRWRRSGFGRAATGWMTGSGEGWSDQRQDSLTDNAH